MKINKHLDLLGRKATDRVTGFKGVITSVSFDLYGCVQAILHPRCNDKGRAEPHWFDIARLIVTGDPVMPRPDWGIDPVAEGKKGPAEKPAAGM